MPCSKIISLGGGKVARRLNDMPNDLESNNQASVIVSPPLDQMKGGGQRLNGKSTRDYHELHPVVNTIFSVLIGIFTLMCVFPFIYVIIISFTSEESIVRHGFQIIPAEWSTDAYRYLWNVKDQLLGSYGVTILITVLGTVISVLMISFYAYAISRPQFKYRRFFTFLAFFTMLFSGGLVPTYIVVTQFLGLKNSIWALILPLVMNAFYIIIMRTFFYEVCFRIYFGICEN